MKYKFLIKEILLKTTETKAYLRKRFWIMKAEFNSRLQGFPLPDKFLIQDERRNNIKQRNY